MWYPKLSQRPEWFTLNPESPLHRGLVFAGLGRVHGAGNYFDSSPYRNHGTLTGYTGAGNTPANRWSKALGRNVLDLRIRRIMSVLVVH